MPDLFISHASEDKDAVARPLAAALEAQGWEVWLDEDMLQIGDRLTRAIGDGLVGSRYGVVILSASFFAKAWPRRELEMLVEREKTERQDLILPLWHEVTATDIARFSELLADRKGMTTAAGLEPVVAAIVRVLRRSPPNNVPKLMDPTIGRENEVEEVRVLLRESPLVTVLGGAGVGKSRLAIEVAAASLGAPFWGVWFIELASLPRDGATNVSILPAEVGRVIGIPEQRTAPPLEALATHFATGHYFLVLDNCEHVVDACRGLLDDLIPRCPGLRVLTTSRTVLNALKGTGERVYELAPLRTLDAAEQDFERIQKNESVHLFAIRVQSRSSDFRLNHQNAKQIGQLCRDLDGIPLAIEIAAARMSVKSVQQMIDEVRDFVTRLGSVESGTLRRWDTLTAALKWSFDLLPAREQACARALAVFEGGWMEDAVGPIWLGDPSAVVTETLQILADHSFVVTRELGQRKRFRYLEAVRQFMHTNLSADEQSQYERRHAEWFCRFAEQAAPQLLQGDQREWLDRLASEADNLRAVVRWAVGNQAVEVALRLLGAVWRFAEIRGYFEEWRGAANRVLKLPGASDWPALQSKVYSGAGMLAYRQANFEEADAFFKEGFALEDQLGSNAGRANALNDLGNVAIMRGDYQQARSRYEQAMAIEIKEQNSRGVAVARFNLGSVALAQGETDAAVGLFADSLRAFREKDNTRDSAFPLGGLAEAQIILRDFDAAREYAGESLEIRRQVADRKGIGDIQRIFGWLELESGDEAKAGERLIDSLTIAQALKDQRGISASLAMAALWCSRRKRHDRCVFLYAASEQLRAGFGYALPPLVGRRRDDALAEAKTALGEQVYQRHRLKGALLSDDAAIEEALNELRAAESWSSPTSGP